jgi:signal transduction histidine kinase
VEHAKSRVVLRGGREGRRVHLEIADDGPGIEAGVGDRVFERFFRVGSSGRRGSGLGLAIARAAAAASDARLELLPQRTGVGATFRLTMPGAKRL